MKKSVVLLILATISLSLNAYSPDWQWALSAGGSGWDEANSVAVDSAGNIYLAGSFQYTAHFGSLSVTATGAEDIFVAKADSSGNWLWVKKAGGYGSDSANSLIIDGAGNIYITGYFTGGAGFGRHYLVSSGEKDIFIAKLAPNGEWLWSRSAGGPANDSAYSLALDSGGNVYLTGKFYETANFGNIELSSHGSADLFLAKLSSQGDWLWAVRAGGEDYAEGVSIALDGNDDLLLTGVFSGTAHFGGLSLTAGGWQDIFIAKYSAGGSWLWAERAGGELEDTPHSLTTCSDNHVYLTGEFRDSADFGDNELNSGSPYLPNIFVAKLNSGGAWLWAEQGWSSASAVARSLAPDNSGNLLLTGYYWNDLQFGDINLNGSGGFTASLDPEGNWLWAIPAGDNDNVFSYSTAAGEGGNIVLTGIFSGYALFEPYVLTGSGLTDIFLAKFDITTTADDESLLPEHIYSFNYPNPFNPRTTIVFTLSAPGETRLDIYNVRGQRIKNLLHDFKEPGEHRIGWDGRDERGDSVASGVYFYRIVSGDKHIQRKIILIK